jgi:CDP-glucose 4,6-dehydratase
MEQPEKYAEAWNFGPYPHDVEPVQMVVNKMIHYLGKGQWKDVSKDQKRHEDTLLTLDITKALSRLDWKPVLSSDDTMRLTAEWYKNYQTQDIYELCRKQINEYMRKWNTDETDATDHR